MKTCAACGANLPETEFYKDPRKRDGLMGSCRACHQARCDRWRKNNMEAVRENVRAYRAANPGLYARYAREAHRKNPEPRRAAVKKYREANQERVYARTAKWFRDNPAKAAAYVRARDAAKLRQTLPHNPAEVVAIYERARELTLSTGVPHEVDHIVPLRGENVCGLHVPWNLQCLPMSENRSKHNRF